MAQLSPSRGLIGVTDATELYAHYALKLKWSALALIITQRTMQLAKRVT